MKMPSPTTRRWLYRTGNAALGVAVVYGVVNGEEAAAFGILLNALLFMADANVPARIETLSEGA